MKNEGDCEYQILEESAEIMQQGNKDKTVKGVSALVWYASVDVTVTIDYDDIEADTKEEAIQIAKQRAQEGIDYNNCDAAISDMDVFVSEKR